MKTITFIIALATLFVTFLSFRFSASYKKYKRYMKKNKHIIFSSKTYLNLLEQLFEHKSTLKVLEVLTRSIVWIMYLQSFMLIIGNLPDINQLIALACVTIVFSATLKYMFYRTFDIIKSHKEFNIRMCFG